jgi:polar amino acid transport system substrate-binding protein
MRTILLLMLGLLPLCGLAQKRVEVWSYHTSPPFTLEAGQGLSAAFVQLLNEEPANRRRFHFELLELPRKRVDIRLADNRPGVLLWVAPRFLDPTHSARARWTRPLLSDQQDVISHKQKPIDYYDSESLHGLAFGGLLGHLYAGLDGDVALGRVRREDVATNVQNLEKLSARRIDAVLVPHSTLLYYRKAGRFDELYVSPQALYAFRRHVLTTPSLDSAASDYVRRIVEKLPENPRWHALLDHYGLESLALYDNQSRAIRQ